MQLLSILAESKGFCPALPRYRLAFGFVAQSAKRQNLIFSDKKGYSTVKLRLKGFSIACSKNQENRFLTYHK